MTRLIRATLLVLQAFVAFTAIYGAAFVLPTMDTSYLNDGPFAEYTILALALGLLVGGAAIAACVAPVARPEVAGLAAMLAGLTIVGFELVEIAVVGFTLADPTAPGAVAWLQVVYLVVGCVEMALGYALQRTPGAAGRVGVVGL